MSGYPPALPYGAYSQPPNPPYQPSYPNPYMQHDDGRAAQIHMGSNFNASAYAYNNAIPGFSAGPAVAAPPPLPDYHGWNQEAATQSSYSVPQSNASYAGYAANSYQAPHQQPYAAPQPQTYHQNSQPVAHYDEGELSEGEFDAYGGRHDGGPASAQYGSNYFQGNDGSGYANTANRAVYPNSQDYSNRHYASGMYFQNATSAFEANILTGQDYDNYQRESASYSPYAASPLANSHDERWKGKQNNAHPPAAVTDRQAGDTSWIQSSAPQVSHSFLSNTPPKSLKASGDLSFPTQTASPATHISKDEGGEVVTNTAPKYQSKPTTQAPTAQDNSLHNPKIAQPTLELQPGFPRTVPEARKRAEGAILTLWPREVRFPDYVAEGFSPDLIGSLFDDLGFSKAPKAAVSESKSTIEASDIKAPAKISNELAEVVVPPLGMIGDESRGILVVSNGNNANSLTAAPSAALAETEPTEKEKNLKMKMEALRKSRAERAQKAAAKANAQPPATGVIAPQPEATIPTSAEPTNPLTTSLLPAIQSSTNVKPPSEVLTPKPTQPPNNESLSLSTPQPLLPPSQPLIPGLFRASTSNPAPSITTSKATMFGGPSSNQRKRPVAADFDTPAPLLPYKRPFGQIRNDSLVIDVSEEEPDSEDEDVAMDLDSQADQDSPLQTARKMSDQRTATLQDFPPLTNFPSRRAFMSPPVSSAASTPPVAAAPRTTLVQPKDLQQTEMKIQELKKKIMAAEAAKAAKRKAQQTSSGAATPQLQPITGTLATNGGGDIASKVQASLQMQQLIDVADDKVASDQKELAETQAAEQEKAAELKRKETESRRLRREKIATELPRVDAEVEESQRKLQELREAMAKIEVSVQKSLDEKRRMAEEMERLGQEAEDQLQEQKDKLKTLTNGEAASTFVSPPQATFPPLQTSTEQVHVPSRPNTISGSTSAEPASSPKSSGQGKDALPSLSFNSFSDKLAKSSANKTDAPFEEANSDSSSENDRSLITHSVVLASSTSDQALEAALQEKVRVEAESHGQCEADLNFEDSYAPDPAQLAPISSSNSVVEGSPAIPASSIPLDGREITPHQLPAIQQDATLAMDIDQDDENDDYEPPEATPRVNVPSPVDSPPFSPAPPESVADFEQFSSGRGGLENTVENGEEELQINGHPQTEEITEPSNHVQFFAPYESPLKHFRAFRFHPDFKQQVSGGLKSMTYSHKINANTELCRYELAGGVCNDKTCEFQHFRDIALPDDAILSSLGNPEEFPADQQQTFREGLRNLLIDLRARKVRDFDTIAVEVIAHRSKFLGDPSKVLNLDGTTI